MNNNMNNNEYNIKLYNSVFNNIYIRGIIFSHLTLYNILHDIRFLSHQQFEQFKYKEYLNNITLEYDEDLSQLPENIKHIQINRMRKDIVINNLKSMPNHIESIKLNIEFSSFDIKDEFSTLNPTVLSKIISFQHKLTDMGDVLKQKKKKKADMGDHIELNKLLPSVSGLRINNSCSIELKKEMIPSNLKRISLHYVNSIENGCLFGLLSDATLYFCSSPVINQILSNNLVKLQIIDNYNKLVLNNSIIFPESLQELKISCESFGSKLPSNLKSLNLKTNKFKDTVMFPSSLEHISIYISDEKDNKEVFNNNRRLVPLTLKSLEISCLSIVDDNGQSILPAKLEKLVFFSNFDFYFNQVLQVDQLPSSLTYLHLGDSYDQVIKVNVLPSSLKTLVFGSKYTQIINPLAIPQQLELLDIINLYYNHPINLSELTHPNILVSCNNLNLYYDPSNTSIRKLQLPSIFKPSLSTLKLQDKSSLEYLDLGHCVYQSIELSDLPINNNIKTLKLGYEFSQTINLEYFQNLETIILPQYSRAKIKTTTTITNQQQIIYNNYKLKNIILRPNNSLFLTNLDKNFYRFIKLKNRRFIKMEYYL